MTITLPSSILMVSGNKSKGNLCVEIVASIRFDFLTKFFTLILSKLFCLSASLTSSWLCKVSADCVRDFFRQIGVTNF